MVEYINRQDAERQIVSVFNCFSGDGYNADYINGYENGLIDAQNFVRNVPAVDVRVVIRSKWKHYGKKTWLRDDGKSIFLQCDHCNATVMNNGSAVWNYCPDCGAMMEEQDG